MAFPSLVIAVWTVDLYPCNFLVFTLILLMEMSVAVVVLCVCVCMLTETEQKSISRDGLCVH